MRRMLPLCGAAACCAIPALAFASDGGGHGLPTGTLMLIAATLVLGRVGALVERVGQPAVLGELLIGLLLGNLGLIGVHVFDGASANPTLDLLGQLGVLVLLLQVGLHCDTGDLKGVLWPSLRVAVVGVIAPLLAGWLIVGPLVLPAASGTTHLFVGAVLTATSVGITARVLKDLGRMDLRESQIILGAAVIDDVLGLVVLSVVSAIATTGSVSFLGLAATVGKAFAFLAGAMVLGPLIARPIGRWFARINAGVGMKLALALGCAFVLAALAAVVELAPIVGAFAAGLILDPSMFTQFDAGPIIGDIRSAAARVQDPEARREFDGLAEKLTKRHVEDLVEPIGQFVAPFFFILTGARVDLSVLHDLRTVGIVAAVTIAAIATKLVAGLATGRGSRRFLVGVGMVPRGEVGIIFANVGQSIGVLSHELFTIVVLVIMATTFVTPPVLGLLLRRIPSTSVTATPSVAPPAPQVPAAPPTA
ncbi:cation:proton antiporter [Candidatus Uhrbacteria bacterium]|nr:cation:proton antiporter [Candidatus Uhrbacteria bacterium]